jgi:multimeric flavodoxin WrbA
MKTIVLSALQSSGTEHLRTVLEDALHQRGGEVRWIDLAGIEFYPCMACGRCSDTGRCVLKDDLTGIIAQIAACDRLVLATPIFLGVHAPLMKKAVDRFLPLAGELFTVRGGEMHHRSRQKRPFSMVGVGMLEDGADPGAAEAFKRLIARHAVNMACPQHTAVSVSSELDATDQITDALDRTERE